MRIKIKYCHIRPFLKNLVTVLRSVFYGSGKDSKGNSLNDCLQKGSNLIELISHLLFRFRIGKIVVTDIEKAFLKNSVFRKIWSF